MRRAALIPLLIAGCHIPREQDALITVPATAQIRVIWTDRTRPVSGMWLAHSRSDFLPERRKILHGGLPQGGEIASEYSNAWIDMRHDNALNSGMSELRDHCYRRAGLPYATAAVPRD
jgi:hypothetical protein